MEKDYNKAIFVDSLFETVIKAPSLSINNCGYTYIPHGYTCPYVTCRPNGTEDWQLLYVEQGENHMEFSERKINLKAGELILIPPRVYQKYYMVSGKEYKDFWIHFSGDELPSIFEKITLKALTPVNLGENLNLVNAITSLALQIQIKPPGYEIKVISLFYDIFYILYYDLVSIRQSSNYYQIKPAIEYIHRHYSEIDSISDLAALCSISVSRFQYLFKAELGKSALRYITDLKISQAKRLLKQMDYSVSEISQILGYKDALYFSKVFKHYTGKSPTEFKNQK